MEINNTFDPIDIAISGLHAQGKNIHMISSNVANAQVTDNGKGEPYRRVEAVFKSTEDDGLGGVTIDKIVTDSSEFPMILKPGHPDADANGYVAMPNIDLPIEMMNLTIATRVYQANVAVLKRYQKMI